ncbi:hypothetical protein NC653_038419 [Populus alba x Populus x berolinensis]|uniref:Secreted protein n=1 Tax=Populus alba x Populus x berolinensis TaxID=444605 RepID=A0AAD6LGL6_9ROSI|nr:hypothetical protein NC653_038419 [Populus alba x Populus x berolinensis]
MYNAASMPALISELVLHVLLSPLLTVHTGHLTLPRNKVARGSHHVARCIHRRHHLERSHHPGHSNAHKWDCEIP